MNTILYLAQTQENRTALGNYDVFNIIMTNLIQGVDKQQQEIINAAIGSLAYFSYERSYRILLANSNT